MPNSADVAKIATPTPPRRRFRRWLLLLGSCSLLVGCVLFGITSAVPAYAAANLSATHGELTVREGLPVAQLRGTGAELGQALGELMGPQMRGLLQLVKVSPQFNVSPDELAVLRAAVAPEHLAEMNAMAKAGGIPTDELISANLALDTLCTVLAAGADGRGPVRVVRNMDFFPAAVLGPTTVVLLRHPQGKLAFATIGWPGYSGVITGFNESGVMVAILQNDGSTQVVRPGTPIAFRAREVLEQAHSLEEAVATFSAKPLASSHFLFMADNRNAAVCWQSPDGVFHRRDPRDGWLAWSNGDPDAAGDQSDRRAQRLAVAVQNAGLPSQEVTDVWLKQLLATVAMTAINAQAMWIQPGTGSLELGLARGTTQAVNRPWLRLELQSCLTSGTFDGLTVTAATPPVAP